MADSSAFDGKDDKGRFIKGNRFWEARSSHGAKPKFASGEDLWSACKEYFEWVEATPLWEDKLVIYQGIAKHEPVAKMRAMTVGGLCNFLDIDQSTWFAWRKSESDLSNVVTRAEAVIKQQKFEGASADLLNANIIARDLGLADKSELTGKDGGPVQMERTDLAKLSADDLDRMEAILAKASDA